MATNFKHKLTALLTVVSVVIALVCTSAVTAFADYSATDVSDYVASNQQTVTQSGIDPDNYFAAVQIDPDTNEAYAKAQKIVELAQMRATFIATYNEDYVAQNYEPANVNEVNGLIAEYANEVVLANGILGADWALYAEQFQADAQALEAQIVAIANESAAAFAKYQQDAVNAVVNKYNALKAANDNNPGVAANQAVGAYNSEQLAALNVAYQTYVTDENTFVNAVAYQAPTVSACENAVDELKAQALNALTAIPKNELEIAYNAYMDYVAAETADKNGADYAANLEAAKQAASALLGGAISFYDNASADVQTYYSSQAKSLKEFDAYLEGDPTYVVEKVSSISTTAVTVTAKYADNGELAQVIPENCTLRAYQSANGAAKRNATNQIKEKDSNLSVAYFIYISVYKGSQQVKYDLPTADEAGREVVYEVKIDLNSYYNNYCADNEYEADKLSNITDAHQLANGNNDLSLCYAYNMGAVTNLSYTLEGGVLVFTTNSLNNICIAGTGLESLITNPLFWLCILLAIIIIIVIIKKVVKHVRYSIKFNSNGGSEVAPIKAAKYEYFVLPAAPTKEGYVFAGWYTDKDLKNRFIDTYLKKRRSIKLHAKWAAPVAKDRLIEMYEILRDLMRSYKKESFKALLGLSETELLANMYLKENHIQLNLALNTDEMKKEGYNVSASKERKFAEVPCQINISTEELFGEALELTKRTLLAKGLQHIEDYVPCKASTADERKNGFAYFVRNERVAETAEDFFELLRIAIKSYVLEEENENFKPGDKVTLARIYITNEVACLHLPIVKGDKNLGKASRDASFEDTPVLFRILAARDMIEAYDMIDKVMRSNGFTKCPENANDLTDVKLPATNGFAYTLKF
ncbi:MAG: InlB B-repeat-containing protein [Clostridia bacterium]|nr:InlB B-repeat-containing protein [Clostridia bacterium]